MLLLLLLAVLTLGPRVAAADACTAPFRWAEANSWRPPCDYIDNINDPNAIANQDCVQVVGMELLPDIVDALYTYPTFWEFGARFHIINDPNDPDDARMFEVRALVQYWHAGGTLTAQIRRIVASGNSGNDVDAEMPVVPGSPAPFNPQPMAQDMCWLPALLDLGPGQELATGDYYFCVKEVGRQLMPWDDARFLIAAETIPERAGFSSPRYLAPGTWWTIDVDPMIVMRQCDPTPTNRAPVAVASAVPTSVKTGDNVQFTGDQSYDPDGDDISHAWTFGDLGTSNLANPTHSYAAAGTYTATLTVDDGVLPDDDTVEIKVTDRNPPHIGALKVERRKAPGEYENTRGVHTGDTDTIVRISGNITASDGGACDQCTYSWTDSLDTLDPNYADDAALEGTVAQLGLSTVGRHTLTLTVTDSEPPTPLTDTRDVYFYISPLPTLTLHVGPVVWEDEDFEYHRAMTADLTVQAISLKKYGRIELTNHVWLKLDEEWISSHYDGDLPFGGTYRVPGLTYEDRFQWDSDFCPAFNDHFYSESSWLGLQAVDLVDVNGYELPRIRIDPQVQVEVKVPPDKEDWYDLACARAEEALIADVAGVVCDVVGLVFPPANVGGIIAGIDAWRCQQEHDKYCSDAHDPLHPDPNYDTAVTLTVTEPPGSSACPGYGSYGTLLAAAEASATSGGAADAYYASLNRLHGVYAFVPPVHPNYLPYLALQGSQIVRYAQMVSDALLAAESLHTDACGALPFTPDDILTVQERLLTEGWPDALLASFQSFGMDPDTLKYELLAVNPSQLAAAWAAGPPAAYHELARSLLAQSLAIVPSGLVLVGITKPYDMQVVTGTITIEARVVHKKEYYYDCICGDTVVTQISLDGAPIAQVPLPVPNCPVVTPSPTAVPFDYNTSGLSEGPHTISVLAQDGCFPPPPWEHPLLHLNTDTITVLVDHTPPMLEVLSEDVDPNAPGIQVWAGQRICCHAADEYGLAGPPLFEVGTSGGAYDHEICVADLAGNTASVTVGVLRPELNNEIVRARFTDYGTSGVRFPHATAASADIAWLPVSAATQIYSWEGNLRYDAGRGPANHLLNDPAAFTVTAALHTREGSLLSRAQTAEFDVQAEHALNGPTLTTTLRVRNTAGRLLNNVHLAWMLDADLVPPTGGSWTPCCPAIPWVGYGAGRWFGAEGVGFQDNVNVCAGIVPANVSAVLTAMLDGTVAPAAWHVGNPLGYQGSTCAFDGPVQGEPRYVFTQTFDNPSGWVGFDDDLAIVTDFVMPAWPPGVTHTYVYTLTFRQPGDVDADGAIALPDVAALVAGWTGPPGVTRTRALTSAGAAMDFNHDEALDLRDCGTLQTLFGHTR